MAENRPRPDKAIMQLREAIGGHIAVYNYKDEERRPAVTIAVKLLDDGNVARGVSICSQSDVCKPRNGVITALRRLYEATLDPTMMRKVRDYKGKGKHMPKLAQSLFDCVAYGKVAPTDFEKQLLAPYMA